MQQFYLPYYKFLVLMDQSLFLNGKDDQAEKTGNRMIFKNKSA
jgi:hypothetical protein